MTKSIDCRSHIVFNRNTLKDIKEVLIGEMLPENFDIIKWLEEKKPDRPITMRIFEVMNFPLKFSLAYHPDLLIINPGEMLFFGTRCSETLNLLFPVRLNSIFSVEIGLWSEHNDIYNCHVFEFEHPETARIFECLSKEVCLQTDKSKRVVCLNNFERSCFVTDSNSGYIPEFLKNYS